MRVTILGCGPNIGVPSMLGNWGVCDPQEPKNNRTRASIYVEADGCSFIVDTGPDLRAQVLREKIKKFDAIFYTHAHADHINGMLDLKIAARDMGKRQVPIYASQSTLDEIKMVFPFAFDQQESAPAHHYPFVAPEVVSPKMTFKGLPIRAFSLPHGPATVTGYRFGDLGYTTDLSDMSQSAYKVLAGVKVWIVSCLMYRPNITHACLDQVLAWTKTLNPGRVILTHMNYEMDYQTLKGQLPPAIEPAFDGMVIEL